MTFIWSLLYHVYPLYSDNNIIQANLVYIIHLCNKPPRSKTILIINIITSCHSLISITLRYSSILAHINLDIACIHNPLTSFYIQTCKVPPWYAIRRPDYICGLSSTDVFVLQSHPSPSSTTAPVAYICSPVNNLPVNMLHGSFVTHPPAINRG